MTGIKIICKHCDNASYFNDDGRCPYCKKYLDVEPMEEIKENENSYIGFCNYCNKITALDKDGFCIVCSVHIEQSSKAEPKVSNETIGQKLNSIIKEIQSLKVHAFQHQLALEKLKDVKRLLSEVN